LIHKTLNAVLVFFRQAKLFSVSVVRVVHQRQIRSIQASATVIQYARNKQHSRPASERVDELGHALRAHTSAVRSPFCVLGTNQHVLWIRGIWILLSEPLDELFVARALLLEILDCLLYCRLTQLQQGAHVAAVVLARLARQELYAIALH